MKQTKETRNTKQFIVPVILLLVSLVGIGCVMLTTDDWINWILKLSPIIWHGNNFVLDSAFNTIH